MTIMYKSVLEKEFNQYMWGAIGANKVTEAPTIPDNSWAWSNVYKAAHIKDASTSEKAAVQMPIGRLKVGDKVTISASVMNISGTKVKIALDQTVGLTTENIVRNALTLQTSKTNEFEDVNLTHIVEQDGYYSCVAGIFRADVGEFYLRDIVVNVESIVNKDSDTFYNMKKDFRAVTIYTSAVGTFAREGNYGDDLVTITIDSVIKKVTITWNKPFTGSKRPLVFTNGDAYNNSFRYFYRAQAPTNEKVDIYIFDVETNTLQDPATILANSFFSVLAVGFVDY